MQERPVPTVAALRGTSTAALLLVFCCAPAFSAGSTILCAQAVSPNISFDIPIDELSLNLVDLGVSAAIATDDDVADYGNVLALRPPSVSTAPRVERILREIFGESLPANYDAAKATPSSSPNAASLAELTAPGLQEMGRDIEATDAARIRDAGKDVTGVTTRVPGVSEDELARYRRQMFRTDI